MGRRPSTGGERVSDKVVNTGPTLAQLVRKWHKTYSHKQSWEFLYGTDDEGWLVFKRWEWTRAPAIFLDKTHAILGEWAETNSFKGRGWIENIYSDTKIIAADPRFFPKLDRAMQFLMRAHKRHEEYEKQFRQAELELLKEVLK
jgi:hypothetical protein